VYAQEGDWILEGVHGEFYPCKGDIFRKTYTLLADEADEDEFVTIMAPRVMWESIISSIDQAQQEWATSEGERQAFDAEANVIRAALDDLTADDT
jgi:hypothetical protein